jgi:hypothetical protein
MFPCRQHFTFPCCFHVPLPSAFHVPLPSTFHVPCCQFFTFPCCQHFTSYPRFAQRNRPTAISSLWCRPSATRVFRHTCTLLSYVSCCPVHFGVACTLLPRVLFCHVFNAALCALVSRVRCCPVHVAGDQPNQTMVASVRPQSSTPPPQGTRCT